MGHSIFMAQNIGGKRSEYGLLYNWWAVNDVNFGITDWDALTNVEYTALTTYLGGESVAGGHLKESGLIHWITPNTDADNSSGFTALGTGFRSEDGSFQSFNISTLYWNLETTAYHFGLNYNSGASTLSSFVLKVAGFSSRLKYNGGGTPPSIIYDYEGRPYDVININGVYYTKQNWASLFLGNGTPLTYVENNAAWAALTDEGYCYPDGNAANV